jgi:hypothetical protein
LLCKVRALWYLASERGVAFERGAAGVRGRISARLAWALCGLTLVIIACAAVLTALSRYGGPDLPYFLVAEATAAVA